MKSIIRSIRKSRTPKFGGVFSLLSNEAKMAIMS